MSAFTVPPADIIHPYSKKLRGKNMFLPRRKIAVKQVRFLCGNAIDFSFGKCTSGNY